VAVLPVTFFSLPLGARRGGFSGGGLVVAPLTPYALGLLGLYFLIRSVVSQLVVGVALFA